MSAYAAGERAAFDELFRRYAGRMSAVLARGLRRSEDARDLLQQVFLQLHRHRADYQPDRPFRPWFFTIALNLKRQHLRTLGRRPESELDELVMRTLHGSEPPQSVFERRQQLEHALRQLAPESSEVVLMHWFGELSMAEIAGMLGVSESAVKVRAHRAYHAMRASLELEQQSTAPDAEL